MKKGFTLLELVVVIAILAILSALAVPGITTAIDRSNAAKCLINLRALGAGLFLYLGDNENRYPNLVGVRTSTSDAESSIDTVLADYVENRSAFVCPSDREVSQASGTSYYWNVGLNGQILASTRFLQENSLSGIPVMADKEGWHKFLPEKVNFLYADGHVSSEFNLWNPSE